MGVQSKEVLNTWYVM